MMIFVLTIEMLISHDHNMMFVMFRASMDLIPTTIFCNNNMNLKKCISSLSFSHTHTHQSTVASEFYLLLMSSLSLFLHMNFVTRSSIINKKNLLFIYIITDHTRNSIKPHVHVTVKFISRK